MKRTRSDTKRNKSNSQEDMDNIDKESALRPVVRVVKLRLKVGILFILIHFSLYYSILLLYFVFLNLIQKFCDN